MCTKCKFIRITLAIIAAIIVAILCFFHIPIIHLTCRCTKCGHSYDCANHHYCPKWS